MTELYNLLYNESEKIIKKKKLLVLIGILIILIPLFVYASERQYSAAVKILGTDDWRVSLQKEILEDQSRMQNVGRSEEWKKWLEIKIKQQQYYLDNDINPNEPGAPTFTRTFIENAVSLFIPLLVMVVSIDIVSSERSDGTIKALLTRPINRWKILLSKYLAVLLFSAVVVFLVCFLSILISGIFFSFRGWEAPILTGFKFDNGQLITSDVTTIPQWLYLLRVIGIAWFVSICISSISFMVSVIVRNTAAAMGIMLAALIAGSILVGFASTWEGAKYIFSVHLQLTDYISGQMPMISDVTLGYAILILSLWSIAAVFISFYTFIKQDIL
ncbi:MAG: transporter permease [Bacillales bacterium]|jgi:ABC-2 type transport system permease protein|nr:transporter permease [Bacillales bacterium]